MSYAASTSISSLLGRPSPVGNKTAMSSISSVTLPSITLKNGSPLSAPRDDNVDGFAGLVPHKEGEEGEEEVVVGENEVEVVNSNSWREESTHSSVSSSTTSMHGSGKLSIAYIHTYIHTYMCSFIPFYINIHTIIAYKR